LVCKASPFSVPRADRLKIGKILRRAHEIMAKHPMTHTKATPPFLVFRIMKPQNTVIDESGESCIRH